MQVLIVDDHPLFLEALRGVLTTAIDDLRAVTAASFAEAERRLSEVGGISLILLDLWLPDTNGFEGLIALRRRFPQLPILVVSAFAEPKVVDRAKVCGATDFISKKCAKTNLIDRVRSLLQGKCNRTHGEPAGSQHEPAVEMPVRSLTRQQLRVLEMLCQGLLNKQIAYELQVSETTVKAHVSEILRKLNVSSRTQAVVEVSRLEFGKAAALYH